MKKTGLLNSELSRAIALLGHGDAIVIADAGLPIPADVPRIDLALTCGVPSFIQVLGVVLGEMKVERYVTAAEISTRNPEIAGFIMHVLADAEGESVSHEQFKVLTRAARAVVRTGECSPYANVILHSGVVF